MEEIDEFNYPLNFKQEDWTYTYKWKLPTRQELLEYMRFTKRNILRSGKVTMTAGIFQGPEKYFEFYIWMKNEDQVQDFGYQFYGKMSLPITKPNEVYETLGTNFVEIGPSQLPDLIYDAGVVKNNPLSTRWFKISTCVDGEATFRLVLRRTQWGPEMASQNPDVEVDAWNTCPNSSELVQPSKADAAFLFSPKCSDLLISCGDREYAAHKFVLCRNSDVFSAMFEQEMVEKKTGKLTIQDFTPAILEEFLRFIYTGNVLDLLKNAEALFRISHKYGVSSLNTLCEVNLRHTISVKNAVKRYRLGHLYNIESICTKSLEKIRQNKNKLWKSPQELTNATKSDPELMFKVFNGM